MISAQILELVQASYFCKSSSFVWDWVGKKMSRGISSTMLDLRVVSSKCKLLPIIITCIYVATWGVETCNLWFFYLHLLLWCFTTMHIKFDVLTGMCRISLVFAIYWVLFQHTKEFHLSAWKAWKASFFATGNPLEFCYWKSQDLEDAEAVGSRARDFWLSKYLFDLEDARIWSFSCLSCLIQEVFMEICREEDRSGATKDKQAAGGGRERGRKASFLSWIWGWWGFCLGYGATKYLGPSFPLGRHVPAH
jgi:hypothetical protein